MIKDIGIYGDTDLTEMVAFSKLNIRKIRVKLLVFLMTKSRGVEED